MGIWKLNKCLFLVVFFACGALVAMQNGTEDQSKIDVGETKESLVSNAATVAMGASLAYAFFRWHNWGDIKRWDVWAPLSLSIMFSKFSGAAGRSAALSYGPMAGTIVRFIEQGRAQGGVRSFAKRSYQATTISPVSGFFAGLGAVAGFFTGMFDLNLLTVLRPVATLFFGAKNGGDKIAKTNETDSFKNPKTVGAVSCYLVRTLDPLLYPVHAPLVAGAESVGKCVRAVAVQMRLVQDTPQKVIPAFF